MTIYFTKTCKISSFKNLAQRKVASVFLYVDPSPYIRALSTGESHSDPTASTGRTKSYTQIFLLAPSLGIEFSYSIFAESTHRSPFDVPAAAASAVPAGRHLASAPGRGRARGEPRFRRCARCGPPNTAERKGREGLPVLPQERRRWPADRSCQAARKTNLVDSIDGSQKRSS